MLSSTLTTRHSFEICKKMLENLSAAAKDYSGAWGIIDKFEVQILAKVSATFKLIFSIEHRSDEILLVDNNDGMNGACLAFAVAALTQRPAPCAQVAISNSLACLKLDGILAKFSGGDGVWREGDVKYAVRFKDGVHPVYEVIDFIEKSKR